MRRRLSFITEHCCANWSAHGWATHWEFNVRQPGQRIRFSLPTDSVDRQRAVNRLCSSNFVQFTAFVLWLSVRIRFENSSHINQKHARQKKKLTVASRSICLFYKKQNKIGCAPLCGTHRQIATVDIDGQMWGFDEISIVIIIIETSTIRV